MLSNPNATKVFILHGKSYQNYFIYTCSQRLKIVSILMCTGASDSSWASMCLAMTLVIGPCLAFFHHPSLLKRIRPQIWIVCLIINTTYKRNQMSYIKGSMYTVVIRQIQLASIIIDLLKDLEGSNTMGNKFWLSLFWKSIFSQMKPNPVTLFKNYVPLPLIILPSILFTLFLYL